MLAVYANDVKGFMSVLLKTNVFDYFQVRNVNINTFASFEIDCKLDKGFFTFSEQEEMCRNFCTWKEIKPYAFNIIKGNRPPKLIKIIFSLDEKEIYGKFPEASALFLNIIFQNEKVFIFSGYSQKLFSMDKSLELKWDKYISSFLTENSISVSTHV